MLNYLTHSVLFPLTIPMYTRQLYKLSIFLLWVFTIYTLVLGCYFKYSEPNNFIDYSIKTVFFIISSVLVVTTMNTRRYRSLNDAVNFVHWAVFWFILFHLHFGIFENFHPNKTKDSVKANIYIFRIASIVLSGLLILYLCKNYIYLSRSNKIIDRKNVFMRLSRIVQVILIVVFTLITGLQIYRTSKDPALSMTNLIDIIFLIVFFLVFNFQLYKRFGSNNVMLFPLIYRSKNMFIFN